MKKYEDIIYAEEFDEEMVIYLRHHGQDFCLMKHRYNWALLNYLWDGKSESDLRSFRPGRSKMEQKLAGSLRYILKVANYVKAEAALEAA